MFSLLLAASLCGQVPTYRWVPTSNPDQTALYIEGQQVGVWCYSTGIYSQYDPATRRFTKDFTCSPYPPPPAPGNTQPVPPATYTWKKRDEDQWDLFRSGVHLGSYSRSDGKYYPYDAKAKVWLSPTKLPHPLPPEALIPVPIGPPPHDVPNYGVDKNRVPQYQSNTLNGRDISQESAMLNLRNDSLLDDSGHLIVTIIDQSREQADTIKQAVLSDPHFADLVGKAHIQAYGATDPMLACGFVCAGHPTVYVQTSSGKVLHRQDDFSGGVQGIIGAVRKANASYDPTKDPNLNNGGQPSLNDLLQKLKSIAMANPMITVIAAIAGFYLLRAKPQVKA